MTDDERRDVAERLRAYGKEFGDPTWRELCNVVFFDDDLYPSAVRKLRLIDRLADLIDPGESGQNRDRNLDTVPKESPAVQKAPERDREVPETCEHWLDGECYALRTVRPVDREALLALADKLDGAGQRFGDDLIHPCHLSVIADAIRDALGEVGGCRRA